MVTGIVVGKGKGKGEVTRTQPVLGTLPKQHCSLSGGAPREGAGGTRASGLA